MAEFKLVLSGKDGKGTQKVVKEQEAASFLKKRLGDKFNGSEIGMEGYEFEITGGSDKCGFPMRKGILQTRQKIKIKGKGVGFCGKDRNNKTQKGLMKKRTVCGERIGSSIVQINLKVLKEGTAKLGAEETPAKGEALTEGAEKASPKEEQPKAPMGEPKEIKKEEESSEKKEAEK